MAVRRQNSSVVSPIVGLATVKRFIGSMVLTAGAPAFLELPRDFVYVALLLRLQGTLTVAGGTTSGTLHDENPMSLLTRLIVEGSGGPSALQLKNLTGPQAYRTTHLLEGIEQQAAPIVSAGAQTGTAYSANLILPFALDGVNVGPDIAARTLLDPSQFTKLNLEVDAGTTTAFINGGDRTVTLATAPQVDVYAIQAVNVPLGLLLRPDMRARGFGWRYIERYLFREQLAALATARKFSNALPTGNPYRYLMLSTKNEVTNTRQPVDDTLGALQLFISSTLVQRFSNFREYAEINRLANYVQQATNPAGLNPLGSRDNPVVGHYMFDFAEGGKLRGILDASRFPRQGITIDLLHDVVTASTRQIDVVAGLLVP